MRFYAFKFESDACTMASDSTRPRIAGTLYHFKQKRERDAYVDGKDLPEHLDSYASPCHKAQGEFRLPVDSTDMPKGWRSFDAVEYQKINKILSPKQAA